METIAQWHKQRYADVTSNFGDLALEQMIEITDTTTFAHIAGVWQPDPIDGAGLVVSFSSTDDVKDEEGNLIEGEVLLVTDESYVRLDEQRYAMATAQPGSPFLLAIYNSKHERLESFSHIESFPYNEQYSYIGQFVEAKEQQFTFLHTSDVAQGKLGAGRRHQSSIVVEVTIAGEPYQLRPFASGSNHIIVFRDETSNSDVYEVGRMLVLEALGDNKVRLDFNKAFLPPCAFSAHFNCPMPPLSNRVAMRIEAGEMRVVNR